MKRILLPLIPLSALFLFACDGEQRYAQTESNDRPADRNNSANTDGSDRGDIDIPDGVTPITAETPWCTPQPVPYDTTQIPTLPLGVELEGFCDGDLDETFEGEPKRIYALNTSTRVLEVHHLVEPVPGQDELTFEFDVEGRVRHIYNFGSNGFYDTSAGASWYDLDESGEMVHKIAASMEFPGAPEEDWQVLVKTQRFDEAGHLLERVEHDGEDGPVLRTWTWLWEGDAMVMASLTDVSDPERTRTFTAAWTYTDAGLPASVTRTIDGVEFEREGWEFDEDGALTSRSYWKRSAEDLAASEGGEVYEWSNFPALDDHQPAAAMDYMANPWRDALPTAKAGCAVLPRGPGHGYPDAEPEHQLGVSLEEGRPNGIGFAYGNDTYAWYYGDLAWYGHDGLGSGWVSNLLQPAPSEVAVIVNYRADRAMASESANITTAMGVQVTMERSRTFNDDGTVATDHLLATNDADDTLDRTLVFERNDDGHIVARSLVEGEQTLERQTWERDAKGRALRHELMPRSEERGYALGWAETFSGFAQGESAETSWTWTYEGDLLMARGGGVHEATQTMEYDEAGRVTAVRGAFTPVDGVGQTWTYDDEGRVITQCSLSDPNTDQCTYTTYDKAGRVALRHIVLADDTTHIVEHNAYTCDP